MRVAYVVTRFPSTTETFIAREMAALRARGLDITLLALRRQRAAVVHPEASAFSPLVPTAPQALGAQIRWLRRRPREVAAIWRLALRDNAASPRFLLRAVAALPMAAWAAERVEERRIDHVHAHWATHSALVAWAIHRLTGRPFSITAHAHDIFVEQAMLRRKLDEAEFIAVISDFNARYLTERFPGEVRGKLAVVHCGVEADRYAEPGTPEPARDSSTVHLVCVASLEQYKGHAVLLEALGMLRHAGVDVHTTLIGDGPLRASLMRNCADRGLSDTVAFTGALSSDDVVRILADADVFVLPSIVTASGKMEGIPVALMEAAAAGLPAVASDLSGIPEVVIDGETGILVPPGEPAALADALRRLVESPDLRRGMGRRGRRHILEHFTIDTSADQLLDLFEGRRSRTQLRRAAS